MTRVTGITSQKNDCDFQDDWVDWGDFGDQEDWGWVDGKSRMTKMTGIHQDDRDEQDNCIDWNY